VAARKNFFKKSKLTQKKEREERTGPARFTTIECCEEIGKGPISAYMGDTRGRKWGMGRGVGRGRGGVSVRGTVHARKRKR